MNELLLLLRVELRLSWEENGALRDEACRRCRYEVSGEEEGYGYPSEAALLKLLKPETCWLLMLLLLVLGCLLPADDSMAQTLMMICFLLMLIVVHVSSHGDEMGWD